MLALSKERHQYFDFLIALLLIWFLCLHIVIVVIFLEVRLGELSGLLSLFGFSRLHIAKFTSRCSLRENLLPSIIWNT